MTDLLDADTASAPGTYPVPAGRGRWRLMLHNRTYADTAPAQTVIADLTEARSRKLVTALNTPATFSFVIDGWRPAVRYIAELCTEVVLWRFDDTTGNDVVIFRGPITASVDTCDEQSHSVTFSAVDYGALLFRRIFVSITPTTISGLDQDYCAGTIVRNGIGLGSSSGTGFDPGRYLPLAWSPTMALPVIAVNPDGTARAAPSGVIRTLSYQGNAVVGQMLSDLAKLGDTTAGKPPGSGSFDYDVAPFSALPTTSVAGTVDALRIFYPQQGITRTAPALYYPGNVTALTRAVTSADYSNYWRTIGNNQNVSQSAAQFYGEAWTSDAITGAAGSVGLWENGDQVADSADQTLLGQAAQGQLNLHSVLLPTYTVTLAPGFYYQGAFCLGDTLPLIVQSGRLAVNTTTRVVGLTYEPGDDGPETVTVTLGRSPRTLAHILGDQNAAIRALARR